MTRRLGATESDSFAFIASLLVVQADQRGLEHHLICRDELEAEPFDQCLRKNLRGELERRCAAERRTLVRVDVRARNRQVSPRQVLERGALGQYLPQFHVILFLCA